MRRRNGYRMLLTKTENENDHVLFKFPSEIKAGLIAQSEESDGENSPKSRGQRVGETNNFDHKRKTN